MAVTSFKISDLNKGNTYSGKIDNGWMLVRVNNNEARKRDRKFVKNLENRLSPLLDINFDYQSDEKNISKPITLNNKHKEYVSGSLVYSSGNLDRAEFRSRAANSQQEKVLLEFNQNHRNQWFVERIVITTINTRSDKPTTDVVVYFY